LPRPYRHLAWNLAGDAEINDDLLAAGVPLPQGVVTPAALGCEDGGLAEDYYASLTPPPGGETGPGGGSVGGGSAEDADDGGAGCGSGAGCPAVPGELPAGDGTAPGISTAEGDLVRRRVAEDVKARAAKGRGTVPAGLDRWAETLLAPPTVPWDRVLRAAVRRAVADQAGRVDYTYTRPSRRQVPGVVKPAMRGPSVVVSVVVDTSGSMSQGDLDAAMGEVQGVLRSTGVARDQVRIVSCDAEAEASQRVRSVAGVRLTGGGGTDMRVGIAAAEETRPRPHVVIVLTDGATPWPERPGRARLVCGVISPREPVGTPAWATTVHIPPAA
jgi:predicted metal-dependent peptidase